MTEPGESLTRRVETLLGRRAVVWTRRPGGYTPAERWVAQLEDGSSAFVKAGAGMIGEWLRAEHRLYASIRGSFLPKLIGWSDEEDVPVLVLEDLSGARWPPPWEDGDVSRVLETLEAVRATPAPTHLPPVERTALGGGDWRVVERDPEAFLGLGLCTESWLARALPVLVEAEEAAPTGGAELLHTDVRSDNLCLTDRGAVLVDWNLACIGNGLVDVAFWLPSLRLEGGPLPEEVLPGAGELAARVAGFFAARAPGPQIPDAPGVRRIQLRQLRQALPWAARALGLPPPDVPWAQRLAEEADADIAAGRITEDEWHERLECLLADAYLASDDPRAQSGKGGDEQEWRWARELVLDAVEGDGTFLDVGCANGYLMQSIDRWAAERGLRLEVYGLELSERLASLARRRLPEWRDRIFVGNVAHWSPPRRFDTVHTGIDYVPHGRRRELVERLLRDVVAPGGRLVFRPERVREGAEDLGELLAGWGFRVGGRIERRHPTGEGLRRTVWLDT